MACVYSAESMEFGCIREILDEVRSGSFNVETIRKIIKQVDSGLAIFGAPADTIVFPADMSDQDKVNTLCDELEAQIPDDLPSTSARNWVEIIKLLMELWKVLQPLLPDSEKAV